jgi:hypothetical protein
VTIEEKKEYYKQYYQKNKEAFQQRREKIKDQIKEYNKNYFQKNKQTLTAYTREYFRNLDQVRKEKRNQKLREYSKNNREFLNAASRKNYSKYKNNINYKLAWTLRRRLYHVLKLQNAKKYVNAKTLVGCTIKKLKEHIEQQWQPGMSWKNHSVYGWHIDHIKPCSAFDLTDPIQQKQCFHYTNLQPLWAKDNLKKSNKYNT